MLADIPFERVQGVAVAIVRENNFAGETIWNVYLLNLKNQPIDIVLVTSRGYGILHGENVKTSILRHLIGSMTACTYVRVESIPENLFPLFNEFWVSFRCGDIMYDKKYIFVPNSIHVDNFVHIPILNKRGVMIV